MANKSGDDILTLQGTAHEQDETGQLAGAFDQMAETLQAREADRRRAEQTHAQLAAIVESSTDAIVGRTLDGLVTSWNKGAETLFGYSKEEMIGQPILILVPPDEIESVARNFEKIKGRERIDSYETVRLTKGGNPVHVSVTVSPVIGESGKIIGASSITRDITERKRAENKLKALHDLNLAITSTLDLGTILRTLLEKIEAFLPYAASHMRLVHQKTGKMEPVACRNMDEEQWKAGADEGIQHPTHRAMLQSKRPVTIRNLQEDESIPRREFYRAQGLVSYLGVPLTVKGEVIGILSLLTRMEHEFTREEIDFTEALAEQASIAIYNSQLYQESKRLSEERQASENQIRALASGLMHARDMEAHRIAQVLHDESGQLLTAVYIALDEMAKGLSPSAKENIQKIKGLLDCVEARLRDLSHELHPAILDHLGLLPSLEFLSRQVAKRAGVRVKIDGELSGRLSPLHELTLYRVVQEALNNATRHSRAKTVDVRVFEDEELIRCSIQDDGVGFDPEELARRTVDQRQGVGLAGMRQRVAAVGGTFQVNSAPGQGTQLLVAIPREKLNGSPSAAS
jgi:PAS domain S-box-containing protein